MWSENRNPFNRGLLSDCYGDGDGLDVGAKDAIGVKALVGDDFG